jgi:hypothetical protein
MVHSFALLNSKDRGLATRLTVTCAELVEGAFKRAPAVDCALHVELDVEGKITARVSHVLDGAAEARLFALLREVNAGQPLDAYTRALSHATAAESEAMLSLARIRYEGQMVLSLQRADALLSLTAAAR